MTENIHCPWSNWNLYFSSTDSIFNSTKMATRSKTEERDKSWRPRRDTLGLNTKQQQDYDLSSVARRAKLYSLESQEAALLGLIIDHRVHDHHSPKKPHSAKTNTQYNKRHKDNCFQM